MKRSEIISISSVALIFIITSFALKDIFGGAGSIETAMFGAVSGLLAFLWMYKLQRKWTDTRKVVFTVLYLIVILSVARYSINRREAECKRLLIGKWISPQENEADSELIFEFKPNDSLIVTVDSQKVHLAYEIKEGKQIVAGNESIDKEFKWLITTLVSDMLIIGDGKQIMELERMQ